MLRLMTLHVFGFVILASDCFCQDVVLARVLDEATVASLDSMIHSNNAIVISLLKDDSTFIQELFARLRSPTTF
ncbi:Suppressor of Mek1 [Gossypium arboreum]|uniref:Suppressor of Mek1 n=1 Tax=Gossypium arboreum TaxID=29729 RepID=A0A0B0MI81_GOSAR|nr:Suppressor of Mek1 [Gossypium arboreum]